MALRLLKCLRVLCVVLCALCGESFAPARADNTLGPYQPLVPGSLAPPAAIEVPNGSGALVPPSSSNPLAITCISGCSGGGGGGGTYLADEAAFAQGATDFTPIGGFYNSSITNLTSGQGGAVQLTADRMMYVNIGKVAGSTVGSGIPVTGTFWQATQPVSAASLPLPTGAATAANQEVTAAGTSATSAQGVQGVTGGVPVPVSGTIACSNCSGGASFDDEASFSAGTTPLNLGGGFYQTTATSNALTNGQGGAFQLTANRALFTNLRNSSGTEIGTASTPVQVSLASTGLNSTAVAVSAASLPLPSGAATAANQTNVQGTAGSPASTVVSVQGVASGTAVPISSSTLATAANQTSVQGTVGAGTAPADMNVGGGLYNSTLPTPSAGQSVAAQFDSSGRQITTLWADKGNQLQGAASATGTSATTIIAAQGSGIKIYVTDLQCYRSDGGTSAVTITLNDGSSWTG
jgi:hypothetical protein